MWLYQNQEFTEIPKGYIGFVYEITNTINGRRYFGKKLFFFSKTKIIKGKKKKVKSESDWKDYYSSSPTLQEDVEKIGKENFKREILYLCKNKGTMTYLESKLQFVHEVLERPNEFYNQYIQCRIQSSHVKI